MKPTRYIDADFIEWFDVFYRTVSALPSDSVPQPVHCRSCGAILDGVAAGVGGIATQRIRPMVENDDGLISFWSEPVGEPVLHRGKPFRWQCRDCKGMVKLVPQKVN